MFYVRLCSARWLSNTLVFNSMFKNCAYENMLLLHVCIGHVSSCIPSVLNACLMYEWKETFCMPFFQITNQRSPQIKLWGGGNLKMVRSKTVAKLYKILNVSILLCTRKMVAARSSNNEQDTYMIGENDIIHNVAQKCPTIAQVTMSQKKVKAKLFPEAKWPPFWLRFQDMNWTNGESNYPIDEMELISDLIKKKIGNR